MYTYLAVYLQAVGVLTLVTGAAHLLHVTDTAQGDVEDEWLL